MRKILIVLLLVSALLVPAFASTGRAEIMRPSGGFAGADLVLVSPRGELEGIMAYCALADLAAAYGEDRISAWSRLDPDTVDRAINSASAEIDGYLISGGYAVPLSGPPKNIQKYCVDIAAANLVISAGVLKDDPGGNAVLEEAKNARRYLAKVAEGKFKIPGFAGEGETIKPPSGGVQVASINKLDLRGY
jgi:phage gp36-like protein